MKNEKNMKIDTLDDLVKGIKTVKKRKRNKKEITEIFIQPINHKDKIYKFSLTRYIKDCAKRGIRSEITSLRVERWAKGYDGKIAIGNMVYDDNGLGIPAYSEWCLVVSQKEYMKYLKENEL